MADTGLTEVRIACALLDDASAILGRAVHLLREKKTHPTFSGNTIDHLEELKGRLDVLREEVGTFV